MGACEQLDSNVVIAGKNPPWRPFKYAEPEEFYYRTQDYFDWCDSNRKIVTDDKGRMKTTIKPYTVTGLCNFLGITRDTFIEYEKRKDFVDIIKMARQRIEGFIEETGMTGEINPIFAMFRLKQADFGWQDKQEVVHTNNNTITDVANLSIDDLKEKLLLLEKMKAIEVECSPVEDN